MHKWKAYSCEKDINIINAENKSVAKQVLEIKKKCFRFDDPAAAVMEYVGPIELKPGASWTVDKSSINRSGHMSGFEDTKPGDKVIVSYHDGENFVYKKVCIIIESKYSNHRSLSEGCLVGWLHESRRGHDDEFRYSKSSVFSIEKITPTLFD